MSHAAELSSLATAAEDLNRRITAIADSYAAERREDLAADLYAVERQLHNVVRRLNRAMSADSMSAGSGSAGSPGGGSGRTRRRRP